MNKLSEIFSYVTARLKITKPYTDTMNNELQYLNLKNPLAWLLLLVCTLLLGVLCLFVVMYEFVDAAIIDYKVNNKKQ